MIGFLLFLPTHLVELVVLIEVLGVLHSLILAQVEVVMFRSLLWEVPPESVAVIAVALVISLLIRPVFVGLLSREMLWMMVSLVVARIGRSRPLVRLPLCFSRSEVSLVMSPELGGTRQMVFYLRIGGSGVFALRALWGRIFLIVIFLEKELVVGVLWILKAIWYEILEVHVVLLKLLLQVPQVESLEGGVKVFLAFAHPVVLESKEEVFVEGGSVS